jgi:hypothetical protein
MIRKALMIMSSTRKLESRKMESTYNKAFFGLYENMFCVLKETFGKTSALDIMSQTFKKGLKEAYDSMHFQKGVPEDFVRVVGERDRNVGLKIKFPEVSEERIVYQFHTDPFPNLKGEVLPDELGATYLSFKVDYLLGHEWTYRTTKHLWKGDPYTEHVISKTSPRSQ